MADRPDDDLEGAVLDGADEDEVVDEEVLDEDFELEDDDLDDLDDDAAEADLGEELELVEDVDEEGDVLDVDQAEELTIPTFDEDDDDLVRAVADEDDEDDDGGADGLREGEFVCRSCYMAKRESALADHKRMLCRDCA